MGSQSDKEQKKPNQSFASANSLKNGDVQSAYHLDDNRPEAIAQRKLQQQAVSRHQTQSASNQNTIQKKPTIQKEGGYHKLVDPAETFHKNLGKQLIATYRTMDAAADALQIGKNRSALKEAVVGLAKAGIQIATMIDGIPSITEGSDFMAGEIEVNLGADTLGAQVGSSGGTAGLDATRDVTQSPGMRRAVQDTTTGGALRNKIHDKVGNLHNTCKTLLSFVPFFDAATNVATGVSRAATSKDDWNRKKGILFKHIRDIEVGMRDAISGIDTESYGNLDVTSANKTNFLRHTTRTLNDVLAKFNDKSAKLRAVTDAYSEKHAETVPLLTQELDDEE